MWEPQAQHRPRVGFPRVVVAAAVAAFDQQAVSVSIAAAAAAAVAAAKRTEPMSTVLLSIVQRRLMA